ncbi:urea ABC transporter substrate-binding protein [Oscillatoria salina]|uniref:urea ABC transporter substrate-binding protein n=1 Tax=Oscillatoria salina TaxID=331517 RepID=UPI0013BCA05E|nr:urea ABC transporter substrate-binding protein [Oscillatoria salina]MBZ8182581.1 urea ABC transporter substrate-binding protein [Oscillatoria salina IIICB1]NET90028.1 urea ABC transporter substrate-binding protein [Kamptonema sp. SIO1D9]
MREKSQPVVESDKVVYVGILHSQSGAMSTSEASLQDAELMAIAEINATGGVLGKQIVPIVADGASKAKIFASEAKKLIESAQVATIFGGWTSASRKAVLPVVEQLNNLLWYPSQYEGLEASPNIFYTGSCPNQQIEPAVNWLLNNVGTKFYLLGSDHVYPRTANKIVKAQLKRFGGSCVGEEYAEIGANDFQEAIAQIKLAQPDVVFSSLNGESNLAFYQQYQEAGITAAEIPIMSVSISEEELQRLGANVPEGHYAAWSYFQTINTPKNQEFVANFQKKYGQQRAISDPIEAAYTAVYLWKQAVELAGSFATAKVRQAAIGLNLVAPVGKVTIEGNNHLWKPLRIGKIQQNGQFTLVWDSNRAIAPEPWLGIERLQAPTVPVIVDLLKEVSNGIEYSCQLEEKSRALEGLMAELIASNQQLRQTQQQLLAAEARNRELQQREKLLQHRLSSQIRDSLESDTIVNIAVNEIHDLLNIDCCLFLWYIRSAVPAYFQATQTVCDRTKPESCNESNSIEVVEVLGNRILETSWLAIDDLENSPNLDEISRLRLKNVRVKGLLAAPVHTRSGASGIVVCTHNQVRVWTDQEIEMLISVVEQLAIAIDQAKLYEESCTSAALAQAHAKQLQTTLEDLKQTQAQLVQTEKMSTLGQLVAGVAHEINNPVSFICGNLNYAKGYTQDLLDLVKLYQQHYPQPKPEIKDFIAQIELDFLLEDLPKTLSSMEIGSSRIHKLVTSLRNFSRRGQAKMQPFNLHEGIETTLLILSNRLKAQGSHPGIKIIKEYGELPPVDCYPSEINQVFMNLLGNAIDALEEKENLEDNQIFQPQIWIRTEVINGEKVQIHIGDNGPGISSERISQMFEPFFTTKPIGKGTGLGLSISHQIIVEKHQGKIECFSQPGEGTEFIIELPISQIHSNKESQCREAIA